MNTSSQAFNCRSNFHDNYFPHAHSCTSVLKFNTPIERKIMKAFLLNRLHLLFCDLFHKKIQSEKSHSLMECYTVDSKIIQFLIQSIIDTGEYTLEGIAHYTRIPLDVIFDAACGNNVQLSMTLWVRVIHLYIQVKPDVAQLLFDKLNEINDKNHLTLSLLLNET
jgi:hypothetical protein